MTDVPEDYVFLFCERLRQIRKRLGYNIEELSNFTGLSFGQIQRIEGSLLKKNQEILQRGGDGRASTIITLLTFYNQRISIDFLFNFKIPVSEIPLEKRVDEEIAREKILSLIERVKELANYI
jgi:transcriptional regulator with XRE-family HTH domain